MISALQRRVLAVLTLILTFNIYLSAQCGFYHRIALKDTTVCEGLRVELLDTAWYYDSGTTNLHAKNYWRDPYRYVNMIEFSKVDWDASDGLSQAKLSINFFHVYDSAGDYTITMISKDSNNCFDTVQTEVYISSVDVELDYEMEPLNCSDFISMEAEISLGDSDCTNGFCDSLKYIRWIFTDDTSEQKISVSRGFYMGHTHPVRIETKSEYGCVSVDDFELPTLLAKPYFEFESPSTDPNEVHICMGDSIEIFYTVNGKQIDPQYTMEWGDGSFSGLDTSQSFRWHQYVKPGTYTLNFDYQDQFEGTMIRCVARFPLADSNVRTVVVHDRAEAQLLVHTNPSFIGHPTAFTVQLDSVYERFLLDFGDNQSIVALADTPFVIHKYHTEGLHFAILTPFFTISQKMPSCPKRDTVLVVILQDSLNSIDEYSTEIKMYPNPTTGTLNIQTQNAIESLRLYSTDGQLVYTKGNAGTDLKLELEFLSSGLYIVEMLVGQQVIRRMVVLR